MSFGGWKKAILLFLSVQKVTLGTAGPALKPYKPSKPSRRPGAVNLLKPVRPVRKPFPGHKCRRYMLDFLFKATTLATHASTQTDRQAGRQAGRQARRQLDRQQERERQTDSQTERQTARQTDSQTDRQAGRQADRQTEGRRPGASFRALLFGTGEGAVCEPCRLEDSRPQPHAGECAGEALFLALAKAPFVSFGGWKKASFVSLGGWKGATFLVGSEGDVRHGRPGLKPYKPFRRPFHGNSSNCGFYVVLGASEGKKSEKFAS